MSAYCTNYKITEKRLQLENTANSHSTHKIAWSVYMYNLKIYSYKYWCCKQHQHNRTINMMYSEALSALECTKCIPNFLDPVSGGRVHLAPTSVPQAGFYSQISGLKRTMKGLNVQSSWLLKISWESVEKKMAKHCFGPQVPCFQTFKVLAINISRKIIYTILYPTKRTQKVLALKPVQ